MEFKNLKSSKIKLVLLDIFPTLEDLKSQDKGGLSIIFHGINIFYDLEELISQRKEVMIIPHQTQIRIIMSIIKGTDILATGQMLIKQGTQTVTFSYENKEKSPSGNLYFNLIDCIKINISCEIINANQNSHTIENISIDFNEGKDNSKIYNSNKKMTYNFQKKYQKKNHNNSQEFHNNVLIENINNYNTTNKKKNSSSYYNLDNHFFSTMTKNHSKKSEIRNTSKNLNNSLNSLYKKFNNNFNSNNKRYKKRMNNSEISSSNFNTINNNNSSSKIDSKDYNLLFCNTSENFNSNNNIKKSKYLNKYISSSEKENNPNIDNYAINTVTAVNTIDIDDLLSDKIKEHVNVGKTFKKMNYIGLLDKSKFKKINNYNNHIINKQPYLNRLIHSKTKTSNLINVNKNNSELSKSKNDNDNSKRKTRFNNSIYLNQSKISNMNNTQRYPSNYNLLNPKKNNNINIDTSSISFMEEIDKNKNNKTNNTIYDTKRSKKIKYNEEIILDSDNVSFHKSSRTPRFPEPSEIKSERLKNIIKEEEEYNPFNILKDEFLSVYNEEYIGNIKDDLLKLEIELFTEKITELIKVYHSQIDLKSTEHKILKNNYKNNVKKYLYYWKLYNKLQYKKVVDGSKEINPWEDKKQIEKDNINKVNVNKKEITIFKTLFSNKKENRIIDDNKVEKYNCNNGDNKAILKNIILNALGDNDMNILWILKNNKYKNWIHEKIVDFLK